MGTQDGAGMEVFETPLPGVGTRYEFSTAEGERLGVVARRDNRRDLLLYDEDDPDSCRAVVELNSEEAAVLVDLPSGSQGRPHARTQGRVRDRRLVAGGVRRPHRGPVDPGRGEGAVEAGLR